MKKALFIAYPFPPLASSGVHRVVRFCRYLGDFGWQPVVLTVTEDAAESYIPRDQSLLAKLPDGLRVYRTGVVKPLEPVWKLKRIIAGHSRSNDVEMKSNGHTNGRLTEAPATPGKLSRFVSKWITNLSIPDDRIGWLPACYGAAKRLVESEAIPLIYTTGFPWSAHITGILLKKRLKKPWIADFRDPWINNPWRKPYPPFRQNIDRKLEYLVMKHADKVIANTDYLRRDFVKRYPNFSEKFVTITNGFDPADFDGLLEADRHAASQTSRRLCITHAGRFYNQRNPWDFLQALSEVLNDGSIPKADIGVELMGDNSPDLAEFIHQKGLDGVVAVLGDLPHQECVSRLYRSDVLLLIEPGRTLQVPSKMYEYIRVGKPVFGIVEKESIVAEMFAKNDIGFVSQPNNIKSIKTKLLELYRLYKANELAPALKPSLVERFDGKQLTKQLAITMNELLGDEGTESLFR
jgi:glycosyltransferase involved in cell wall biosynthesis